MFDLAVFLLLLITILNSVFVAFWYKKIWFLLFTIFVSFVVGVVKLVFNKKFRYYKYKIFTILATVISTLNIFLVVLGYTTNFLNLKIQVQPQQLNNEFKKIVLKGKVFITGYPSYVPAANAKIVLLNKTDNSQVDVFFTDIKGNFEYINDKNLKGNFVLKIEHINCLSYITEIELSPDIIRELEIYLRKK